MANARTRYDTIAEFMTRQHDATSTTQYGKPAVQINGTPFLFYMLPGMAFRLQGRAREQALALPGASAWAPLGQPTERSPWVLVPVASFLRWDRLAIEALRYAQEGNLASTPKAEPTQGPPEPPPAGQRWRDNIKSLWEKAASFRLTR
ncbi:hypothetical protein [Tahibacter harae]|uniref:Uncharacterized protein n=1 Tax=Tahibacter harae TaxID=2963937 RepID=A0ABT1QWC0_9GAMM|nr:hypothetical protein [Tahibacter harae]MCQ4166591.1 hypothetical protein [Tahibacter harae]